MTATCAALVKDTWIVEPAEDGAHRLKGLVIPGLESAKNLVARAAMIKGLGDGSSNGPAVSEEMAALRARIGGGVGASSKKPVLTPVGRRNAEAADVGGGDGEAGSPSTPASAAMSPAPLSPASPPVVVKALQDALPPLPLIRDLKSLGATGGAAAVRSVRTHIPNPVRLRIEAGHQDFVNETRVCTCMFVGFTRMAQTTADPSGGVQAVASATASTLETCVRVLQQQVQTHGGTLLQAGSVCVHSTPLESTPLLSFICPWFTFIRYAARHFIYLRRRT